MSEQSNMAEGKEVGSINPYRKHQRKNVFYLHASMNDNDRAVFLLCKGLVLGKLLRKSYSVDIKTKLEAFTWIANEVAK